MSDGSAVTALLIDWRAGNDGALDQLIPLVLDELRRIARRCMASQRAGHSLQATALVNEAYVRLIEVQRVNWNDRTHFLAMAARLMRRILIDHARAKGYQKRGAGLVKVTFDEFEMAGTPQSMDLVALDDALTALTAKDSRKGKVVELRFFGGLSVDETAVVLRVSPETVMRDWKFAKAWLLRELQSVEKHA